MSEQEQSQASDRILNPGEEAMIQRPELIVDKPARGPQKFQRPEDVNAALKLQQFLDRTIG